MRWIERESSPIQRLTINRKGSPMWRPFPLYQTFLQRRFDLETPRFQKWFRNILGVLVPAGPFAQAGGTQVLVWRQFVFPNHLFEFSHCRNYRSNRLRLPPIRISASLSHSNSASYR